MQAIVKQIVAGVKSDAVVVVLVERVVMLDDDAWELISWRSDCVEP